MVWNFKRGEKIIAVFTAIYLLAFSVYYISAVNYEFMLYIFVVVFFAILVAATLRRTNFSYWVLWGLALWGLLHMAGGSIPVGNTVLYGVHVLPIYDGGNGFILLKFDQLVHFFGFGVSTLLVYELLRRNFRRVGSKRVLYFVTFLGGMGLGALNEIVEFLAVVIAPETGVGGYFNSSLDLVFNMLGAAVAVLVIHLRNRGKSI